MTNNIIFTFMRSILLSCFFFYNVIVGKGGRGAPWICVVILENIFFWRVYSMLKPLMSNKTHHNLFSYNRKLLI